MPNLECFGWFREASPQDSPLSEGEQGKTFSSRLFAHSFCHLTYTPHNHAIHLSLDTSPIYSGSDQPLSAGYRALPRPTAGPPCRTWSLRLLVLRPGRRRPGGWDAATVSLHYTQFLWVTWLFGIFSKIGISPLETGRKGQESGPSRLPQRSSLLSQPSPAQPVALETWAGLSPRAPAPRRGLLPGPPAA